MECIVHRRFKQKAICGKVDLPVFTILQNVDGYIFHNGKLIAYDKSENAHQFFARNDDGFGIDRGKLTRKIQAKLANEVNHQERWDKIWNDELCQKYKRPEREDFFYWNHDFFNAPIQDLKYIWNLIKDI